MMKDNINWKSEEDKIFIKAIQSLQSDQEVKSFLRDLMTENELSEFVKRFTAARMLLNEEQYFDIQKKTGLSSTTIARVSKWLHGPLGGYKSIIKKISHHI